MISWLSLLVSFVALFVSGLTFYYTRLKRGRVKMTKPTTIYLGPDGVNFENQKEKKVFIRTLLYSTSEKGQYIQNMFVKLQKGESIQNFNVWIYGDSGLVRGSGLFVNNQGISNNHHFLLPRNTNYEFLPGEYRLQVFVETVNREPYQIFEQKLIVSNSEYTDVNQRQTGIFYDWAPNSQNYEAHTAVAKHVAVINKKEKLF